MHVPRTLVLVLSVSLVSVACSTTQLTPQQEWVMQWYQKGVGTGDRFALYCLGHAHETATDRLKTLGE